MLKKLITILSIVILSVLCFASCTVSEHNHTKSDWKYSETEHWRVSECDKENCVLEEHGELFYSIYLVQKGRGYIIETENTEKENVYQLIDSIG